MPTSANTDLSNGGSPNGAQNEEIFTGYVSDWTDDDNGNWGDDEEDTLNDGNPTEHPTIETGPNDTGVLIASTNAVLSREISHFGIVE